MANPDKLVYSGFTLSVHGVLEDNEIDSIRDFVDEHKRSIFDAGKLILDFSDSPGIDTVPAVVLYGFCKELSRAGVKVSRNGASDVIESLFKTLAKFDASPEPGKRKLSIHSHFELLGENVYEFGKTLSELGHFMGETLSAFAGLVLHPLKIRWPMVLYYMEESGFKAIPIVAVLPWLLGVVLGYQAGYQMRVFGAETFMPALIGYSITWEIGPMLAAVLVAGRSGSAYAAEIGTMQVREEVDALRVMGFDIFSYLVTPKMIALLCVMPFLVLLANLAGIFGGLLAGSMFLDLSPGTFISELGKALIPLDILWGMLKSVVYAVIIANVGSYMGMKVRGGAAAVGKATTAAVVLSIFMVIIADALLSLLFIHIRPGLSM
ncbi:MAG: MlaE family lipid ABC transporter permease subunit [Candidatus Aegiribacteria sp.]|nr:MlaE family lipid ABC transporter permease subunit [Candidatus Aegiribacteria sp.]